MANKKIDMLQLKQLLRLYTQGVSKLQISSQLGLSRNTVKKYIPLFTTSKFTYEEIKELNDTDIEDLFDTKELDSDEKEAILYKYFPYFTKELLKTGVTRHILWQEYLLKHPEGYRYSQFCYHLRTWQKKTSPSLHMQHKAGDKMFVDYTGKKLSIIDKSTGEITSVEVFISILGSSRMTYVEASLTQNTEDFISSLTNSLHFYQGVPLAIVPDNLKAAVTKSDKYEPKIAHNLQDFALHYNTTILPARSYKPKDKALVENAVKTVYTRVFAPLRNREFFSLQELNQAIAELLEQHNEKLLSRERVSRKTLFKEIEQPVLQSLPAHRYELKYAIKATVQKISHIYLNKDKHYYSVPFHYIGKKVNILYSKDIVDIYHNQRLIASHNRELGKYRYTTVKEHMPSSHQYITDWNPTQFLKWGQEIGESTQKYLAMILDKRQHPEQSYKSCAGILSLGKRFSNIRLEKACTRGLEYERYSYKMIKSILEKGLDAIEEQPLNKEREVPTHQNIRGAAYYQ
ncbi:IS21 family transposase [Myroides odoratimimus]|uniref:IS21 family transposase n=2 Tax=Myroides odoratimimus TaxID=76832 RepID=UPI0010399351|nr:IS21 family transposase [Myroides odoratimimus]QBK75206.1 IS21 family transposase [Myroides odoratimimus]QBK75215.1 IS21 family transposase [Myroides odoratimimus]WHT73889.1 IS21 family transposase [Myroides odoratimimus]WHT73899.1 IS21 family transposase [Myroides odoratimimus]WHU38472.1 IS21 family transposase [Myroides odoratimimus]